MRSRHLNYSHCQDIIRSENYDGSLALRTCLLPRLFIEGRWVRVASSIDGTGTERVARLRAARLGRNSVILRAPFFTLQINITLCVCKCYQRPYKSVFPRELINNVNLSTHHQSKYFCYNGVWPTITWLVLNKRAHGCSLRKWNLGKDNWIVRSERGCSCKEKLAQGYRISGRHTITVTRNYFVRLGCERQKTFDGFLSN
jgi:hypothetical protein